ncbi:MAG: AI-2E family transporter [Burkholderiaceae bacterium]
MQDAPTNTETDSRFSRPPGSGRLAWLLLALTLLMGWVLWPFSGAIWWAVFFAIVFVPWQRAARKRLGGRSTPAALISLVGIVLVVILPLALLAASLGQQVAALAVRWRAGEFNLNTYYRQVVDALPVWGRDLLLRLGVDDIDAMQQWLLSVVAEKGQVLTGRVFLLGQNTLEWLLSFGLMLYLLFFLLRDGDELSQRMVETSPLPRRYTRALSERFVGVVRATVKGNVVVAMVQGLLGMLAFWALGITGALLWGAAMAVLSLIPAVGAALVWGPVAVYMLATGLTWQGVALAAWGTLVIGLVDNVLRPILVGRNTRLPDYVVLFSTLGGLAGFGIQGFVLGPAVAVLFLCAWEIWSQDHALPQTIVRAHGSGRRAAGEPGPHPQAVVPRAHPAIRTSTRHDGDAPVVGPRDD